MLIEEALPYLANVMSMDNSLAMLLGVVVGLVIGAIPGLSPPMAIALMIPVSFQFPPETALILIFSVVGTYAGSNNVYDVWIMIGFGVLGYLMTKFDFVPAGVLLGIILGPIAENGLRDLLIISDGAPIAFALYFSFKPKPWQGETDKQDD